MKGDRSERPPSVRQAKRLRNGTLLVAWYDTRGRVVRETYYWSPDEAQLARIAFGNVPPPTN